MGVWVKKRCEKLRIRSFGAGIFPFKCPCPETFRRPGSIICFSKQMMSVIAVKPLEADQGRVQNALYKIKCGIRKLEH